VSRDSEPNADLAAEAAGGNGKSLASGMGRPTPALPPSRRAGTASHSRLVARPAAAASPPGGVTIRPDGANSLAGRAAGGTTSDCSNPDWNASMFDYGGSISFVPRVDCTCDSCGDSTCIGSLATVCGRIAGCRATLEAAKSAVDIICESHPAYALYSKESEQNVIYYGLSGGMYRMGLDKETGELVGASSSARNGLACHLAGKTDLAAGLPLTEPTPNCRPCAADTGRSIPMTWQPMACPPTWCEDSGRPTTGRKPGGPRLGS
jgi:hypothetical protein